jgi:methionyl aminopeptidase
MITDGAVTVVAGAQPTPAQNRLLTATREALDRGVEQVRAGARIGDISHAIEQRLRRDKLGVIEELSGHGVGHQVHEDPTILNYGRPHTGMKLKAGMSIAIEPMATLGGREIMLDSDGWTIKTYDGSLGAQFEHTVIVTEDGCEIVTL